MRIASTPLVDSTNRFALILFVHFFIVFLLNKRREEKRRGKQRDPILILKSDEICFTATCHRQFCQRPFFMTPIERMRRGQKHFCKHFGWIYFTTHKRFELVRLVLLVVVYGHGQLLFNGSTNLKTTETSGMLMARFRL